MDKLITMKDYIYATPQRVIDNTSNAQELTQQLVELFLQKNYTQITFVASGSSYTAIQCARGFISKTLNLEVKVINPYSFSEYDYQYVKDDHFIIITTQSGASTNCINALKRLKSIHHDCYVLTGNINSDCQQYADTIIDWGCGIETMGYVTLGVVTLVVYLMLFAVYCAKALGIKDDVDYCHKQILKAMNNHQKVCLKTEAFIQKHYQSLMQMDRVYILGAGCNYGTALEGALKIGETVKVLAIAYEQDEFLHGPALQLNPKYTTFVIDSGDHTSEHAMQVFEALNIITPHNFMITPQHSHKDTVLTIPDTCDEPFTCLYYLPFFELIAEVISTDLNSKPSHPLYYEMNRVLDFRTSEFRKTHSAKEDDNIE